MLFMKNSHIMKTNLGTDFKSTFRNSLICQGKVNVLQPEVHGDHNEIT